MGQIRRRQFLVISGAVLSAQSLRAQPQGQTAVLGILGFVSRASYEVKLAERLRELGWIEGKNLRVEAVYAPTPDRLPELAAALVEKKVDVIWTISPWGALAAARATSTIPIVFWRTGRVVEMGLVDSFARPGRNVTGVAWYADIGYYNKRYQLLRELAPDARRLAVISVPSLSLGTVSGGTVALPSTLEQQRAFLRELGFESHIVMPKTQADLEQALGSIANWGADCLVVPDVPLTGIAAKQIIEFARRQKLIDFYEQGQWVQAGGLASYGIVLEPTLLRTAEMVDRILKGTRPADIPVEMPSRYELVLNLATAKLHGLRIPPSMLLRVDRVIE